MKELNILQCKNRHEFRAWLTENAERETECWVEVRRGRSDDDSVFWYLDAVEEALCFGWIDSTHKVIDGRRMQRFPPLYQRIRAYNVAFYKKRDPAAYQQALQHLIDETKKGRMFGEWNDYGRLLDY